MNEAWEEEQMSNLGCESVSDLIAEVKRLLEENALLASQIRLAYEWVEAFHNEDTMISFIEHVYGDEEE